MVDQKESLESRLQALESLCAQFSKQIHAMKKLVESKVSNMQSNMDAQVAEIKQLLIQQDRTYRERMRRLDQRIEQLSEFAVRLARNKCGTTVVGGIALVEGLSKPPGVEIKDIMMPTSSTVRPTSPPPAPPPPPPPTPPIPPMSPTRAISRTLSASRMKSETYRRDESATAGSASSSSATINDVLRRHKDRIEEAFSYYIGLKAYSEKMRRSMDLEAFSKMVKDVYRPPGSSAASLPSQSSKGDSPVVDLLWLNIIHKVFPEAHPITEMNNGWELGPEHFGTALQVLAAHVHGQGNTEMPRVVQLETFLTQDLFPVVKARRSMLPSTDLYPDVDMLAILQEYSADAVAKTLQRKSQPLREKYRHYAAPSPARPQEKGKGFTLSVLIDMAKDHDVLPFTNKHTLRSIFNACLDIDQKRKGHDSASAAVDTFANDGADANKFPLSCRNSAREPGVSFDTFLDILKGIAHVIYGGPHCAAAYPTPESRIQKLLSKLLSTT